MEQEIIKKIIDLVNQGYAVRFEDDFSGNTLTLYIDNQHTHCGVPEGSYEKLIKDLHGVLVRGSGLTFA